MLTSRIYFYITAIGYIMAIAVFVLLLISKNQNKMIIIAVIVIIIFMMLSLPAVNLFSQTMPIWPPRGTIYQMPTFSNSISQNDVGLMMKYYLDGKTLYANEDYPLNSHKGFIYITDEYDYVQRDYPTLDADKAKEMYGRYEKLYITTNVRENTKLKIDPFRIHLYIASIEKTNELHLLLDDEGTWYFMTDDIYEEAMDE